MNKTGVKRCGDDVVFPKCQLFAIGDGDFIRNILSRKRRQGFGTGNFHRVIDGARVNIERSAK